MNQKTVKKFQAKFKKAPGAPKRFKSAFIFFSENEHKVIRGRMGNKKIRAADAAKMVSHNWKHLSEADRSKWQEMAAADKDRFEREKAAYKGPWKVPNVDHPNPPKKPMSAYLAFSNERRKAMARANPSLTNAEVSSLLSKLWRQCPADLKNAYRIREASARGAYKKYLAEWKLEKDLCLLRENVAEDGSCADRPYFSESRASSYANVSADGVDRFSNSQNSQPLSADDPISTNFHSTGPQLGIRASCGFDLGLVSGESLNVPKPNMIHPLEPPIHRAQKIFRLPLENEAPSQTAFETYTLQQLIEDEELFEDFSPGDVKSLAFSPHF